MIGDKEKLLRLMQEVSIADLSDKSGVPANVLSQLKGGHYNPSSSRVRLLLRIIESERLEKPFVHIPINNENILATLNQRKKSLQKQIDEIDKAIAVIRREMGRDV